MSHVFGVMAILLLLSATGFAAEVPESMKGTWKINHDESMELMKSSPKYNESEKDMVSRSIMKREPIMALEVTGASVELAVGERTQVIPFTVVSATETDVATKATLEEKEFDLQLKLIRGKYLQMVSSASDDMNYLAWEKK